jgi:predicted nucleic acid-binding protein
MSITAGKDTLATLVRVVESVENTLSESEAEALAVARELLAD